MSLQIWADPVRERDRQTETQRERQTDRQTDRQRARDREIHTCQTHIHLSNTHVI